MRREISEALFNLESTIPPNPISSLRSVEELDWNRIEISDQQELCDLILRLSAELIVHRFSRKNEIYDEYEDVFNKIRSKILRSELHKKLDEFGRYFTKYCEYLDTDQ